MTDRLHPGQGVRRWQCSDIDPLIEPLPAVTLTHTAQSSSAPLAAPLFSLQTSGHQTLSVSVTLPATAADLLSLEDRITASLVWSTSRRVSVMTRRSGSYRDTSILSIMIVTRLRSLKPFTRRPGLMLQTQNIRVSCFISSSHLEPSLMLLTGF